MEVSAFAREILSLAETFSPPPVEILEIALPLRFLQGKLEVLVYFRDLLEVIRNLETLHI